MAGSAGRKHCGWCSFNERRHIQAPQPRFAPPGLACRRSGSLSLRPRLNPPRRCAFQPAWPSALCRLQGNLCGGDFVVSLLLERCWRDSSGAWPLRRTGVRGEPISRRSIALACCVQGPSLTPLAPSRPPAPSFTPSLFCEKYLERSVKLAQSTRPPLRRAGQPDQTGSLTPSVRPSVRPLSLRMWAYDQRTTACCAQGEPRRNLFTTARAEASPEKHLVDSETAGATGGNNFIHSEFKHHSDRVNCMHVSAPRHAERRMQHTLS